MSETFGAFGKMPALGDFFQINPPQGFIKVWDAWVQNTMMTGRERGEEDWDEAYMSAPIWRFTLAAGVAGPAKAMGVLMPSVDRVGRRFPLSLMSRIERDGPAILDHLDQSATFEMLETIALSALDDDMDKERLAAALSQLSLPAPRAHAILRRAGGIHVMTNANSDDIAPELAAGLLDTQASSLWTAILDDTSHTMICDGLPEGAAARALFDLSAPFWAETRPTI